MTNVPSPQEPRRRPPVGTRSASVLGWLDPLGLCAVAVAALVLFDNPSFLVFAVQADSLQLPSLVWDLSVHDYAWRGFQLARVPSLFPDLAALGALEIATSSWRVALLAYGMVSLFGLALSAGWIIDAIANCGWRRGTRAFLVLALPILILELPVTGASQHLEFLIPNNHGGPFILALAGLGMAWSCLRNPSIARSFLLFALITAGVLSDLLFIIAFNGPVVLALGYFALRRAITRREAALVLLPVVLGIAAAQLLDLTLLEQQVMIGVDWSALPRHVWLFLRSPGELVEAAPLPILLGCALPLVGFAWFLLLSPARGKGPAAIDGVAFWRIVSATSVLATIGATALVYGDAASYRYMSPFLWWPIIATATAVVRPIGHARRYLLPIGLGAEALALIGIYVSQGLHPPAILALRHPIEACLSAARETAGLKAGLADYWYARPIAASSDWQLQVDQASREGAGRIWGNDRRWFTHDIHDGARPPAYNYFVMTGLDPRGIRMRYGAPSRTLNCPSSQIWIYDDTVAFQRAFLGNSPDLYATFLEASNAPAEICVPADRFESAQHRRHDDSLDVLEGALEVHVDSPDSRQPRIWGPHLSLPAGRWNLSFAYRLASDPSGPSRWEVTSDDGRRPLMDGLLTPTGGGVRTLSMGIDLPSPAQGIQIRAFLAGTGSIEVAGARIAPAAGSASSSCGW